MIPNVIQNKYVLQFDWLRSMILRILISQSSKNLDACPTQYANGDSLDFDFKEYFAMVPLKKSKNHVLHLMKPCLVGFLPWRALIPTYERVDSRQQNKEVSLVKAHEMRFYMYHTIRVDILTGN